MLENRLVTIAAVAFLSTFAGASAQEQMRDTPGPIVAPEQAPVREIARPAGMSVVAPPPAGFDPQKASPQELARYAFPPAPDAARAPHAYASWQKVVQIRAGQVRPMGAQVNQSVNAPVLKPTTIYNRPIQRAGQSVASAARNSTVLSNSYNWSGTSVRNFTNPFNKEAIIAEFVVPTARQALYTCNGGWDYSSLWPGIDGNGSTDVLQAGVEVDSYCRNYNTQSFYSAWIEWYPYPETQVSTPTIGPGDLIYIEVWNVSPTAGYATIVNLSTQQGASYNLTAPAGTSLVGNSAEWIVERPGVSGGLANLTNYVGSSWTFGVAWDYTASPVTYYFPGLDPGGASTFEIITMLDGNNKGISSPTIENAGFLYFQDYGSACGNPYGSPPC